MTRWHRRACPECGLAADAGAFRLLDPHASSKAPDADDPKLGRLVGNFPQAFSHIGLVNTALLLDTALGEREA